MPYLPDEPARRDRRPTPILSSSRGAFARGVAVGFASLVVVLLVSGLLFFWGVFHAFSSVMDDPPGVASRSSGSSSPASGGPAGSGRVPGGSRVTYRVGGGTSIGGSVRSGRR